MPSLPSCDFKLEIIPFVRDFEKLGQLVPSAFPSISSIKYQLQTFQSVHPDQVLFDVPISLVNVHMQLSSLPFRVLEKR
jgi:hypothetical protein